MKAKNLSIFYLLVLVITFFSKSFSQTTQATNAISAGSFLGTSNSQDVFFKWNNINSGLIAQRNTSFGAGSLNLHQTNQSPFWNVAIGVNALSNLQPGDGGYNTAVGASALAKNKGQFNSAFGNESLSSNVSGGNNVAVGFRSMQLADGQNLFGNIAIGEYALRNATNGHNIAIGNGAGSGNGYNSNPVINSGTYNTFIGSSSGYQNTTGNTNIGIGYRSLYYSSTGNNNIGIGANSGNFFSSTGNLNNICIGSGHASYIGTVTGSGNVIIGNYLPLPNQTLNNSIIIGDGSNNVNSGNIRIFVNQLGNTGLGTLTPNNKLEIKNNNTPNSSGLRFTNLTSASNVVANPSNPPKVLSVDANGDVILVNDAIGTGSGGSTIITAGTNINVSPYNATTGYTISSPYQTLSQSGNIVTLTNGGSFTLPTFTDTDTDDQTLSITGNVLSISEGNSVTLPTTSVIAGTNVVVTGTGTTANPFVINATATGTGTGGCNIYDCDDIIDTTTAGSPNPGLRTVTMGNNNLFFQTNPTNDSFGRVYIGASIANNGFSTGFPAITATSQFRLLVEGGILSERVKVALRSTNNWSDYVFADDYKLMPLKDVQTYITKNKHLPGIESAETLSKEGLDLGDMQAKQMAKIEELTLYVIEQNKQIEKQNKDIEELKALVKTLLDRK